MDQNQNISLTNSENIQNNSYLQEIQKYLDEENQVATINENHDVQVVVQDPQQNNNKAQLYTEKNSQQNLKKQNSVETNSKNQHENLNLKISQDKQYLNAHSLQKLERKKKPTIIKPLQLLQDVRYFQKMNKVWFFIVLFLIAWTIVYGVISVCFPNKNNNIIRVIAQVITLFEYSLWLIGSYYGKKSIILSDYQNILKSVKLTKYSLIPQIIGCLISEAFLLQAEKKSEIGIACAIFAILFVNIILIYYKVQGIIRKGYQLFDIIEAYDQEMGKDGAKDILKNGSEVLSSNSGNQA